MDATHCDCGRAKSPKAKRCGHCYRAMARATDDPSPEEIRRLCAELRGRRPPTVQNHLRRPKPYEIPTIAFAPEAIEAQLRDDAENWHGG